MNLRVAFLLALLCTLIGAEAVAQQRLQGSLPGARGQYTIDLPDGWQPGDRLILYQHGLTMQQPSPEEFPSTAPDQAIRDYWLERGYALAAGSYASRGWAVFDIAREQRALLAEFDRLAGAPGEILLVGGSLGGLVALRSAEIFAAEGTEVAGVYALCAPVAGARVWDTAVDTRLLFDAVCPTPLPAGSSALPWVIDYQAIPSGLDDIEHPNALLGVLPVANIIRKCTGMFQPAMFDTEAQRQRLALLKQTLGISSDDFLQVLLAYAIYPLADLIQDPEKLAGHNPLDNRFVDYQDGAINAGILRVERDPLAAVRLRGHSNFHGDVGAARVLALHSQRDELVVPEHLSELQQRLPAAQLSTAVVAEPQPAHCEFSRSEFVAGFAGLRRWIDQGDRPSVGSLQADCLNLPSAAGGGERCAFDASLEPGSSDQRIRPRDLNLHQVSRFESGAWYDPDSDGEGLIIEVLEGEDRAVVAWYSYPASGEAGEQTWIIGLGRVTEDGIHVAEARHYRGARFGPAFDPDDIDGEIWGELTLWFDGCGSGDLRHPEGQGVGRLRFSGPLDYGDGERTLFQLSHNGIFPEHCTQFLLPQVPPPHTRYSGSWYRGPQAPGEGLQLQVDSRGFLLAIWYTFDPAGNAAWLIGTAPLPVDGEPWVIPMQRPRGTRFGPDFDPDAVQRLPWGEIEITFNDCDNAELSWTASEAGWPDGQIALQRLTRPAGLPECGS